MAVRVAFGYLGLILVLLRRGGGRGFLARQLAGVGRTALSCYMLQNVLAMVAFSAWGLGLGPLGAVGTVIAWTGFVLLPEPRLLPTMAQAAVWVVVFGQIAEGTDRMRVAAVGVLGGCVAAFAVRGRLQLATARAAQAERLRELDARSAAHDERVRLARELHDVVANRLSAVAMRITAPGHVRRSAVTPEGGARRLRRPRWRTSRSWPGGPAPRWRSLWRGCRCGCRVWWTSRRTGFFRRRWPT
ncbi:DUF418 domain-containing protein [Streptomyces acidiscabies]|uniref:histidine kinase n=1 Tax=Streptomyces acidiscabies TaxID=42234 RepID=A0AAP6EH97_9ACTN|nr:DUF418 domain-containing protein [Streptomyces acidiscabies]MDX2962912.1 DUF418 domain-containing protein [Streptomyces acidiscabies]MDX3021423.1 DUF418 domain-containing protein [Streptomyces acidiscabies]MDX3790181.1 DUF418 domain-containing protein [Streptomyces acidiscabies]